MPEELTSQLITQRLPKQDINQKRLNLASIIKQGTHVVGR